MDPARTAGSFRGSSSATGTPVGERSDARSGGDAPTLSDTIPHRCPTDAWRPCPYTVEWLRGGIRVAA